MRHGTSAPISAPLWYAGKHLSNRVAFESPSRSDHLIEYCRAGRIAMIWRSTHEIVEQAIERGRACAANPVNACELQVEGNSFELPVWVAHKAVTFGRKWSVEVRALWRKASAKKSACRRRQAGALRPDQERVT